MKVTRFYLWHKGACREQRKLFKETFGWSVELTPENMAKARLAGLHVYYFTHCLASGKIRKEAKSLYDEQERKRHYK